MIQHDDHIGPSQQLFAFRVIGLIGVDDDNDRARIGRLDRLLLRDEHSIAVFRTVPEHVDHRPDRVRRIVHNDMRRFFDRFRASIDTDGRAERIDIRNLVPHDEDLRLAGHDFLQGMCLDTSFDARVLLHALGLPAEIAGIIAFLDHDLISAAPKGQLDRTARELRVLHQIIGSVPDADRNRHRDLIADIDRLDVLEELELLGLEFIQRALLHHKEVLILLSLLADSVHIGEVFVDLPLNEREKQRPAELINALQCLFVIVKGELPAYDPVLISLGDEPGKLCDIEEVDGNCGIFLRILFSALQIDQLVHHDLLHRGAVSVISLLDGHLCLFCTPGKFRIGDLGKCGHNVLVEHLIFPRYLGK